ncbi:hypothetical protein [Actinopolymorpha alba]|uniref:hypothetical protein n=1 Tax=Actinopolymorpha alba TaxID=533267 RepID=UPI0003780113|nr:hypothetical protein [Actinopolymorpha alba]
MWHTTLNTVLSMSGSRLLALLGLPRLPDVPPLDPATHTAYEEFTSAYVDPPGSPEQLQPPGQTTTYLRWLARHRQVLFHGSQRDSISELRPDRESNGTTAFGSQRAVFATEDPVWAMWFALLTRGPDFHSTRNGVWSVRGNSQHRHYFFSVNSDQPDAELLADGWVYVLPRAGFMAEPAVAGLLQSGQWVNANPVRPLTRIPVAPADFPFTDIIGRHSGSESMLRTLWNTRSAYRRR